MKTNFPNAKGPGPRTAIARNAPQEWQWGAAHFNNIFGTAWQPAASAQAFNIPFQLRKIVCSENWGRKLARRTPAFAALDLLSLPISCVGKNANKERHGKRNENKINWLAMASKRNALNKPISTQACWRKSDKFHFLYIETFDGSFVLICCRFQRPSFFGDTNESLGHAFWFLLLAFFRLVSAAGCFFFLLIFKWFRIFGCLFYFWACLQSALFQSFGLLSFRLVSF